MFERVQCKAKNGFLFRLFHYEFICAALYNVQCTMCDTHISCVCPPSHFHILHLAIGFRFLKYQICEQCSVNALNAYICTHSQIRNLERNKSDRAPALNMFHCCTALNHCAQPEAAKCILTLVRSFQKVRLLHWLHTYIYIRVLMPFIHLRI